jgi:Ni,Fe-hydrogenase III small subunit
LLSHRIQVFSGGCKLCKDAVGIVEVGKCKDCEMEVLDVNNNENYGLAKQYGITGSSFHSD